MSAQQLLLGCDPEVFVEVPGKRQRFISAHDLVPGSKQEPFKLLKGAVQADGTAAEFNIDPCKTIDEWLDNLATVQDQILAGIKQKIPNAKFDWSPIRKYSPKYWETKVPDYAKELGCDPDYNAYTGKMNPRPDVEKIGAKRSAGGHIHFGWTSNMDPLNPTHFTDCCILTKALDTFLFPFSPSWDNDRERMSIYGRPGAFRPKPYGMEYRVLSNAWVKDTKTQKFVYLMAKSVFNYLNPETGEYFRTMTNPSPFWSLRAFWEEIGGNPFEALKKDEKEPEGTIRFKYNREIFKELGY